MSLRRLAALAVLGLALTVVGCGAGSGRSGTDLAVSGTLATPDLLGGDAVSFVMTVVNRGDFEATDLEIRNATLQVAQAGLTIDCTASGGAMCPAVTGASMAVARLPAGGSLVFEVRSTLNIGASGTFSNTMVVSSDTADVNSANNTATVSGTAASNDIDVSVTAPTGPLVDAATTFTALVVNAGPDAARDVVLTTTVSDNVVFVPADLSCVAEGGAADPTLQEDGTLRVATLPASAQLTCTVPLMVTSGTNGIVAVSMASTSAGDGRTGNDTATGSVSATLVNDVGVSGTAPAGPLVDGPAVFTMVVSNAGPAAAQAVALTTTASTNVAFSPAAIACVAQGGAQVPTLQADQSLLSAAIPAGGQLSCSVPVTVAPGTSGAAAVSMTATAAADVRAGNNTATASVSATLVNDLNVSGSAAAPSVAGGKQTSFTLIVNNSGPATAYDVLLGTTLSSGLSLSGAVSCTAAGGAVAPVANVDGQLVSSAVPVGGVLTCTVPVTVDAGASGVVFTSFSASAAGETRPGDNTATVTTVAVSSNLGVSHTGPEQASAGTRLSFVARVNNPGPSAATNLRITWSTNAPTGVVFETPTCSGLAGAVCPDVLGSTMSLASLPAGRTLVFTFDVTTPAAFRGDVVNAVAVSSDEDIDLSNNSASATARVVDPRSGSYGVFAADGRSYDLVLDIDGGSYTLSGNGDSVTRTFTAQAGEFTVDGNARFRAAADMLVGGHDFGAGVLPFIAVRSFASGLAALAGSYNLATRIVAADGTARTLPGTAFITGNTLSICESETAQVATVRLCTVADRKDFLNLTFDGSTVSGVSRLGEPIRFSVATSGGAKFLLSSGTTLADERLLRIGVIDSTGGLTFGPAQFGASTTGDWVSLTVVDSRPVAYTSTGSSTDDSGQLVAVTNSGSGPFSMLTGTSVFYNGPVYFLQSYPLQILVGGAVAFSSASGLLQLTLP